MPGPRRTLVICRTAPTGAAAREALDVALSLGAFEQPVSLLFLGDAVLALRRGDPGAAGELTPERLLGVLPDYGIDEVLAAAADLDRRGLAANELATPVTAIDEARLAQLLAAHDVVLAV